MSRLIIDNRSSMPMETALEYIIGIIERGRISNNGKQYCYLTVLRSCGTQFASGLTKTGDKFTIVDAHGYVGDGDE